MLDNKQELSIDVACAFLGVGQLRRAPGPVIIVFFEEVEHLANLSFNFSGEWEDVRQVLRRFSADAILMRISIEAIDLQKRIDGDDKSCVRWVKYDLFNTTTRAFEKKESVISVWGLIELAYYAIMASNDYRGEKTLSDEQFFLLFDAVEGMRQKREKAFLDTVEAGSKEIYMYLWGFAGEQFKVQEQRKIFGSAGRELYILLEGSRKLKDSKIDIPAIIQEEMGMSWEKVICGLLLGWACSKINCQVTEPHFSFGAPDVITKEEYLKVIAQYSINYDELRKSEFQRQTLYTKPYIHTQKNETLSVVPYLNLSIYEHAILWIVRDHFKKQKDQRFTSFFGACFEKYFEELLNCFLSADEFERIPETSTSRADWKLQIGRYGFLIEQKSSLVRLDVKQQTPSLSDIEYYAKQTLIKAIKQLDNTEREFAEGQFFKIILLYDDYLGSGILEQVFAMEECTVESDDHFWLVTIEEMEILLGLCAEQPATFTTIIEEKNNRETSHSNEGKRLIQIMREHDVWENAFLKREEIAYYRDFALNQLSKLFGKNRA